MTVADVLDVGQAPIPFEHPHLPAVAQAVREARRRGSAVILLMGAHVIKCGLNPIVIELLKRKVITCVALNGACLIHDFELAFQGKTSEDVGANLKDGSFGMGRYEIQA